MFSARGDTVQVVSPGMSIRRKPRPSRVRVGPAALVLGALMLAGCGSGGADGARQRPSNNFSPAPSAPGAPVPGTSVKRSFGLDIHDPMNHWPSQPFGFIRLWDANVEWAHIAPSRGVFDFSRLDQYVSQAEKHHVEIIYVMGNTPWWAATNPNSKSNENIPGANSSPTNLQDWQDYVRAVVTRYQGRIQAYEIWNEANLAGYSTGSM